MSEFTSFAGKIVSANYKRVRTMRHGFIEGEYIRCYDKGMMYVIDTSRARCACERFSDNMLPCGHILYAHPKDLIRGGSDDLLEKFTNNCHSIHALSEPLASKLILSCLEALKDICAQVKSSIGVNDEATLSEPIVNTDHSYAS
ncbi:unnamed protein product [Schistosoma mattheei]|uniref:Uncharacterized protein n=1 Tax=Schistosoma mattheei TaxID=31246 RepID=A0A183Q8L6_9TREM|nr:unnamed protein product [Schistosoma mattheei]